MIIPIIIIYTFSIGLLGKDLGLLFATITLALFILTLKICKITGIDKLIDRWL